LVCIFNKRQLVQLCSKREKIEDYYQILEWDKLPIFRGHLLTDEDLIIRKHILNLMCEFSTRWTDTSTYFKRNTRSYSTKRNGKDGL
jgi:oxygen-independent coproporphyrinogen-3 oxidase